jgi:dGTPase
MEIEAAGFSIIQQLLDLFSKMLEHFLKHGDDFKHDMRMHNIYQLLPPEYRARLVSKNPYRAYLVLTDYISGMTDRYALELYQKVTGTSVVLGRML